MAFQAHERKRMTHLSRLTRRRNQIRELMNIQDGIEVNELRMQRKELTEIRAAHEETIKAMMELPEYEGEFAEKLQENVKKFEELYETTSDELRDLETRNGHSSSEIQHQENPSGENPREQQRVREQQPPSTHDQLKALFVVLIDDIMDSIELMDADHAQSYSLRQLNSSLDAMNAVADELRGVYLKLMQQLEGEQRDEVRRKFNQVKAAVFNTSSWINDTIEAKNTLVQRPSRNSVSNNELSAKVKLPPIEIPKFGGAPEDWISFRDLFITMIHENSQLTGSQKFRYLKTCIHDKLSPIMHLTESDAGYEDAWKSVVAFYDNKRKIVDFHFNAFLNAKKMNAESCDDLQKLLNEVNSNIEALQRLIAPEKLFESLAAHVITQRLDPHTRDLWESENSEEIPSWQAVKKFLDKRRKTLCALPPVKIQRDATKIGENSKQRGHHAQSKEEEIKCLLCGNSHRLIQCPQFNAMSVNSRYETAKEKKLCFNCFSPKHGTNKCESKHRCKECKKKHHTMLHFTTKNDGLSSLSSEVPAFVPREITQQFQGDRSSSHTAVSMEAVSQPMSRNQTLLSTIAIYAYDDEGGKHLCRALLDSGSDANFMTTEFAKKINAKLEDTCSTLTGISEKATIIRHKTTAVISSHYKSYEKKLNFSVMNKITGNLPAHPVDVSQLKLPRGKVLADPKFHESTQIDLLLSADVFYDCLLGEKFRLAEGPMMLHTKFGWIIGGEFRGYQLSAHTSLLSCFSRSATAPPTMKQIDEKLEKFFEAEDVPSLKPLWTPEEKYCEDLFIATTTKDEFGRPIVHMPIKTCEKKLGRNLTNATRQFHAQEAKRSKDPVYNKLYTEYMEDFIETGHMSEVAPEDCAYYMPHHGVIKMSSTSTQVRPVFNASSRSETGIALNDVLCIGPTIQPESVDIITRFREGKFVITGDISRMYRQIWVHPSQRKFLSVLWRRSPADHMKHYQMNVVTFGTASASFLATRVLKMIADEHAKQFPLATRIMLMQFYVDDLMFSFNDVQEGGKILHQIRYMLSTAGLLLRKLNSNEPEILAGIPGTDIEVSDSDCLKALGIAFNNETDEFSYKLKTEVIADRDQQANSDKKLSKADVLSVIASIYDPIGWIAPVIVTAKIFMKKLWLSGLDWKTQLPENLREEWEAFRENLSCLSEVKIPRRCLIDGAVTIELIGFCDASIEAYGAVIYARSTDQNGNVQISILCSKSRVAPKNQKTLARLELCAATLLAKLVSRYSEVLTVKVSDIILWSDSTIVLSWIPMLPSKLQTFVGNRVATIQELTGSYKWRHIRGTENPADVVSRGLLPHQMKDCEIWWNGPSFLHQPKQNWPESIITLNEDDPEVKMEVKRVMLIRPANELFEYIEGQKSYTKLRNVFAYVLRFINNARKTQKFKKYLTVDELRNAELQIVKIIQKTILQEEYRSLQDPDENSKTAKQVWKKSPIRMLTPIMDRNGVLRVRGRLSANKRLSDNQKHQLIIPPCNFAAALVRTFHKIYLHPTKTTLMAMLYQKYWIVRLKPTVKKVHYECIRCFRANPTPAKQLMGDLPEARVTLTTPFVNTAVDFTGFYFIRRSRSSVSKAYVVVFKCMCTGAIHLDVASDLTTQSFLAVLDRFVSRRGLLAQIFSDNATNFQGADRELKRIVSEMEPAIQRHCVNKMIKWNFTTPRSPSAGGIYESGVKLMKHHLKRIIDRPYTYEQFYTILCKIEAVLNSRPITPMSSEPEEFQALTPGHFLIGRPLTALPEENQVEAKCIKTHWKGLQQIQQKFWQLWYQDYLHELQRRPLGFQEEKKFKLGDLVLVKEDNLPPMQWMIGRIIKMFPGKDKVVRNVLVKTKQGEKERNVRQLCPFPEESTT